MNDDWTPTCPKCGHPRRPWADECDICGIVFSKYVQHSSSTALEEAPESAPQRPVPRKKASTFKKLVLGCGGLAIVAATLLGTAAFLFLWQFKDHPAYDATENFLLTSTDLAGMVGRPLELGFFPSGSVNVSAAGSTASFSVPVTGPSGTAKVEVGLQQLEGEWQVIEAAARTSNGEWHTLSVAARDSGDDTSTPIETNDLTQSASESFDEHMQKGRELVEGEQYEAAIDEFDAAVVLDPSNPEAFLERGRTWARQEQDRLAVDDLEHALELGADTRELRDQLGLIFYKQDDWDRCIEHLTASVGHDAANAWAYDMRARCYYLQGDKESARRDARKACDLGQEDGCRTLESLK